MRNQKPRLLFLIRTSTEIIATTKCPKDVEFSKDGIKWSLRGLPWGTIGDFDLRFYYVDDPKTGLIGVFEPAKIRHLKNMLKCQDWHLRHILGQPRDFDDHFKPIKGGKS